MKKKLAIGQLFLFADKSPERNAVRPQLSVISLEKPVRKFC